MKALILLILMLVTTPTWAAVLPTLPTAMDPTLLTVPTVTGSTLTATCATLQAQLNAAAALNLNLTHQITLGPAGTVCLGPYFLPAHVGGTGWILITGPNGGVKAAGTRVAASDLASMPTLKYNSSSQNAAVVAQTNAQRYRFMGVSFTGNASFAPNYRYVCIGLLSDGCGGNNTGYIIFDRVILHDSQTPYNTVRAIQGDAQLGNIALIDSYCWGISLSGASLNDAQCFQADKGPGPYLIRNNYLSASGENVMFGGGEEGTATIAPASNITIQYNDFDLPLEFRVGSIYTSKKALLEFKTGTRILVEGNRFTNNDYLGEGFALRLTVRNSTGTSVNSTISDLTIRYNKMVNNTNIFLVLPSDISGGGGSAGPTKHAQRWWIHDNLMYGVGWICGGGGRCAVPLMFSGTDGTGACTDAPACYMEDFTFSHNTIDMGGSGQAPINVTEISRNNKNLDYRDNLINVNNGYGFYATTDYGPQNWGTAGLNGTWNATWTWQNNGLAAIADVAPYPANGSLYPANAYSGTGNFQWVNPCSASGGCTGTFDYTLQATSPAKNAASDGTDMGVYFPAYNAAQAGTVLAACTGASPTWTATIDLASVKSCLRQAVNGDTVNIAAGTATWPDDGTVNGIEGDPTHCNPTYAAWDQSLCNANGTVKYLTIQGAGIGQTIITDHVVKGNGFSDKLISWILNPGGLSRITGIEVRGGSTAFGPGGHGAASILIGGTSAQFRLDHNKFVTHGDHPALLISPSNFTGYVRGVADHNYWDVSGVGDVSGQQGYCAYIDHGGWGGVGTIGDNSWAVPDTVGTSEAMFFENNTFFNDQSVDPDKYCLDGWGGQRLVVRYNLFLGGTLWNNHGPDSGVRSGRQHELYNNQWLGTNGVSAWDLKGNNAHFPPMGSRGGMGVVFNNTVTTTNGGFNLAAVYTGHYLRFPGQQGNAVYGFCSGSNVWDQNTVGQSGWLCLDQTGAGTGDRLVSESDPTVCSGSFPRNVTLGCTQAWPRQVAQPTYVWNNTINGASANGASTLDPPIHVGRDILNIPRPGYTSYTYPHPLAGGVVVQPPAPPTGLQVQ